MIPRTVDWKRTAENQRSSGLNKVIAVSTCCVLLYCVLHRHSMCFDATGPTQKIKPPDQVRLC